MNRTVTSHDIYGKSYQVPVAELTWRPSAYAIIIRDDQLLLVSERNRYHMPGGGVHLGETPEDAVIREVAEETGLTISNPQLVGSLSSFFTPFAHSQPEALAHVQSLLLYYRCDAAAGEVSADNQEEDEKSYGLTPEWVPLSQLDHITVGSTVDWRPIVKRALA